MMFFTHSRIFFRKRTCAQQRKRQFDDGKLGGETNPLTYIDDCGVYVPHKDVPFFLKEFGKLDATRGYRLNQKNTRIMTSTLSTSSFPDTEHTYGKNFTDELQLAIVTHSVKETLTLTPPSYQFHYQQT